MRRSPRNVKIARNHAEAIHFRGVYFFREGFGVLQFRHFLAQHLYYPRRTSRYSAPRMILAMVPGTGGQNIDGGTRPAGLKS